MVAENRQETSRPISSKVEHMELYDVVFVGYPVWATTLPQAVQTFLSEYDFSGKTVIPFCTHDGYGAGSSYSSIHITIGELELESVLYDNSMARQFIAQLPQTITMSNYRGREVYGGIDQAITVEGEGQLRFDDGDITYCPSSNTAAIFYSQSSNPNLTMRIYPIGKLTSDLSIFPDLPSRVEITFEIVQ